MEEIILDVETKKAFVEANKYDPAKLGVSYVGICRRDLAGNRKDEFAGFFEDELVKLWPILEQAKRVIGFNIINFDFPVLASYYHGNLSSFTVLDILEEVKKKFGHRVSLDAIAMETLGVQKSGTGLDALDFFEKGKLEKLAEYCLMDVRITRDIYDYGKKYRYLKFKDKWNRLKQIAVDFSLKEKEGSAKVQMSLGL